MDEQDAGRGAFPRCRRCGRGELVPLSDFGPQGGEVRYKAWVCTAPACGFAVKIRSGAIVRHRGAAVPDRTAKGPAEGKVVTPPAASPRPPPPAAPPAAAPPRTPPGPLREPGASPGRRARPK